MVVAICVVVGITLAIVVGGYLAYRSWAKSADGQAMLALGDSTVRSIASFPDGGHGRIAGVARVADQHLEAPLSGRRCVWWRVTVESLSPGGEHSTSSWTQVIDESEAVDFLVEDPTGRVLVRATEAHAVIDPDEHYGEGAIEDESTTPELAAFLRRWGQSVGDRKLRYAEAAITGGDGVEVVGRGRWEPDPDPSAAAGDYRSTPSRLVMAKTDDDPLYLYPPVEELV